MMGREKKGGQLLAVLAAGVDQSPWVGLEVGGQCLPGACAGLTRRGVSFTLCCRFQPPFPPPLPKAGLATLNSEEGGF